MDAIGGTLSSLDLGGALASAKADLARGPAAAGESAKAAKDFEALLGTLLVKELRRTLPTGFFGEQSGSDTYEGWLDDVLGKKIAESGALNLAGMVKVSLDAKAGEKKSGAIPSAERGAR